MLNHKKWMALLLIVTLLFSTWPPQMNKAYASAVSVTSYPGYSKLSEAEKGILNDLSLQNYPIVNHKNMWVALAVYKKYNLVVYANSNQCRTTLGFGDPTISQDSSGNKEYRYLGYTLEGKEVTNDEHLNDTDPKVVNSESLKLKQWMKVDEGKSSWNLAIPCIQYRGIFMPESDLGHICK